MSFKCKIGLHSWNGCKCKLCGKIEHSWGLSKEECLTCGKLIEIATLSDLQAINNDLYAHYLIVADIDASETKNWNDGQGFIPIGKSKRRFRGVLNGNNHTIRGLHINRLKENEIGLISHLYEGIVKNIILTDIKIIGHNNVGGLLANSIGGSILDCSSSGDVSGKEFIGGLAGNVCSNISGCSSSCNVKGDKCVGGLIGQCYCPVNILSCSSSGEVLGNDEVGGLVGTISGVPNIFACLSTGKVTGKNKVGGLVGKSMDSQVSECCSYANVEGNESIGGLIGTLGVDSIVSESLSLGKVTGNHNVGGLVGNNMTSSISSCISYSKVSGDRNVGGLVGSNSQNSIISLCQSSCEVIGKTQVGGLIGWSCLNCTISKCQSSSKVLGDKEIGGLVGSTMFYSIISECLSSGEVSAKDNDLVSGLVGDYSENCEVTKSYWDIQTSKQQTSSIGGLGKTTDELKQRITYVDWDFDNTWQIEEGKSYPTLRCIEDVKKWITLE